ncbi:MAG: fumarylacetoacetate hydrolase family protein, partial [Planctomycetota bacterium]
ERRQHATVADLIFDIPTLIEAISAAITLEPGDVIATGTPVGVGIGFSPPKFLQKGDVIRIEVPGIGAITLSELRPHLRPIRPDRPQVRPADNAPSPRGE